MCTGVKARDLAKERKQLIKEVREEMSILKTIWKFLNKEHFVPEFVPHQNEIHKGKLVEVNILTSQSNQFGESPVCIKFEDGFSQELILYRYSKKVELLKSNLQKKVHIYWDYPERNKSYLKVEEL